MRDDHTAAELVAKARQGDGAAWGQLVRRYAPLVLAICRQYRLQEAECEDVGQTVWLGLVEALHQLREPAALPGWLATTTRRECLRVVDAARRRQAREQHTEADVVDERVEPPDGGVLAAEQDTVLREAFAQLKPQCQQLLVLLMQTPRLPYAEIAARLDIPVGSIGPNRARCLDRLRKCPALAAWIEAETGKGGG